jgi:hypothetical protein
LKKGEEWGIEDGARTLFRFINPNGRIKEKRKSIEFINGKTPVPPYLDWVNNSDFYFARHSTIYAEEKFLWIDASGGRCFFRLIGCWAAISNN